MQVDTLSIRNIAHADLCGWNIEKNTWSKNEDGTCTRVQKSPTFELQVILNMDAHSNPRRTLKSAQEQDGEETKETELDVLQRQRNKGAKD